jgi:streptogramin lyase
MKTLVVGALLLSAFSAAATAQRCSLKTKGFAVIAVEQAKKRVVILDSAEKDGYVWQWSAKSDSPKVASLDGFFGNPSDVRVKKDGKIIMICSGGAFAKVDIASCKAEYAGVCPSANPHSIEELPDGRIATASSDGASVMIIDPRKFKFESAKQPKRKVLDLESAHGVVWDAKRQSLWAIGSTAIVEMAYIPAEMGVKEKGRYDFVSAGCGKWGHDLLLGEDGLVYFTTHDTVSVFDPVSRSFKVLDKAAAVKSISFSSHGKLRCQARVKWWTDTITVDDKVIVRPGAKFYKARFL